MLPTLKLGDQHELSFRIPLEKTVPFLYPESSDFRSIPPIFATGYMVGLMEWACLEALNPHLEAGENSLGTGISVSHLAATLPDMTVTVRTTCLTIDGHRITWHVEAYDDADLIGEGEHHRTVIRQDKFRRRLDEKATTYGVSGLDQVEQSLPVSISALGM